MSKYLKYLVAFVTILLLAASVADAQNRGNRGGRRGRRGAAADTTVVVRDSAWRADSVFRAARRASLATVRADSLSLLSKSSLERPAFSTARDSIAEVFSDGHRKIFYYGDVTVTYQDMKLTADYMEYDMNSGIVFARGTQDPVTKEWKGQPVMEQAGKSYKMEELTYNFNSRKARIKNMVTQEDDGLLQGQNIKMMADQSINITKGMYTVCDLEHPHYYLRLSAAKVVTKPSQKTVFGPAWPVFEDVPIPLGLPFGFIPKKPQRATGFLMPTFGEEKARGFYLRDMGMYFVIGN